MFVRTFIVHFNYYLTNLLSVPIRTHLYRVLYAELFVRTSIYTEFDCLHLYCVLALCRIRLFAPLSSRSGSLRVSSIAYRKPPEGPRGGARHALSKAFLPHLAPLRVTDTTGAISTKHT